ncbi:Xaa-Pro dipeptidase [Aliikangiella sp. IMCC44632]
MSDLSSLFAEHISDLLARHRQLMQQHGYEYLIVPSGAPIRVYQDDMDYPFKSSFFFRTYVPLTELPHSYVVIGLSGKPTLVYFQPVDFWHSPPADPEGIWPEHFDIQIVTERGEAANYLPKDNAEVAILGETTDITSNYNQAASNPQALINAIYWQRAIKSRYEQACIKRANEIAVVSHKVAEAGFRAGKSEQQIHLAYVEAAGMMEHQMPYSNIVALNEHAAILHYHECQAKPPQNMFSFLIDAGASFNGYHADITRTYSYQQDEFADLIAAMDEVNLSCIAAMRAGDEYGSLHDLAHHKIAAILKDFNFVDMSAEGMVENKISAAFFPHGLGHLIGLQVHDVGGQFADASGSPKAPPKNHPFLRSTRTMQNDMAFTVEPGLYFIEPLLAKQREGEFASAFNWDKITSFMPYGGIRIEDNVIIKADKVINLTRDAMSKLA